SFFRGWLTRPLDNYSCLTQQLLLILQTGRYGKPQSTNLYFGWDRETVPRGIIFDVGESSVSRHIPHQTAAFFAGG
ncbi:hypothetical protein QUB48_12760, partial [Microcoleus sp. ARI1-A5]|uniref:hypothetical protein n=1 Tax=unclassified Microcoleus TaxID=2642155 RepID=UPI002FD70BD6